jgi:hypothetical protein
MTFFSHEFSPVFLVPFALCPCSPDCPLSFNHFIRPSRQGQSLILERSLKLLI